jgi:hypothetical protein
MSDEKHTLHMWLLAENPRSLIVADAAFNARREWCLPRSLIDRLTKFPKPPERLTYQPIKFTLPAWKIESSGLWEFVVS